jgi:protein phosphatase
MDYPVFIQGQGKRSNQEDAYFPAAKRQLESANCFIVCDGVGGHNKGEVASSILSQAMGEVLQSSPSDIDHEFIRTALRHAEHKMTMAVHQQNDLKGMSTTLVLLVNTGRMILSAHVGDSRIYQFRNGKIIYKSKDHSLVEDLLSNGIITAEEAANHPRKNIITRSVIGNGQNAQIDVTSHEDLEQGDLFLLCTDGVLEAWNDTQLCNWSLLDFPLEEKANEIYRKCEQYSSDNFTACILLVTAVSKKKWLYKLKRLLNSMIKCF